jgi:hypothetical protein
MNHARDSKVALCAALVLLCCAMFFWFVSMRQTYFPTKQVLISLPVAFAVWVLCAVVDPEKYRSFISFCAGMVFGSTVVTAALLMFR